MPTLKRRYRSIDFFSGLRLRLILFRDGISTNCVVPQSLMVLKEMQTFFCAVHFFPFRQGERLAFVLHREIVITRLRLRERIEDLGIPRAAQSVRRFRRTNRELAIPHGAIVGSRKQPGEGVVKLNIPSVSLHGALQICATRGGVTHHLVHFRARLVSFPDCVGRFTPQHAAL